MREGWKIYAGNSEGNMIQNKRNDEWRERERGRKKERKKGKGRVAFCLAQTPNIISSRDEKRKKERKRIKDGGVTKTKHF